MVKERCEPLSSILSCCLTYPFQRALRTCPALGPGCVTLQRIPLGQSPFLHHLRRWLASFVRQLLRYYGIVRLPILVHHCIASSDFPMRSPHPLCGDEYRISRFPLMVFPYMPRSPTAQSPNVSRATDTHGIAFRMTHGVGTLEFTSISRLNTWPILTPVNASAMALLPPPHDSGPVWVATPSPYGTWLRLSSVEASSTTPCRF